VVAAGLAVLAGVLLLRAPNLDPPPGERLLAEQHEREAQRLASRGLHPEACGELEQSLKLWPRPRTKLLLGECNEVVGFVGTAWSLYRAVEHEARAAGDFQVERAAIERQRVAEKRYGTLTIVLAPGLQMSGLVLRLDGGIVDLDLIGVSRPIDPALLTEPHRLVAEAPGKRPWSLTFRMEERARRRIEVPPLGLDEEAAARRNRALEEKGRQTGGGPFLLTATAAVAHYADGSNQATYSVSSLRLQYDFSHAFSVSVKEAFVYNEPLPSEGPRGTAWSSPVVGARYAFKLSGSFSLAPGLEIVPPIGSGGGNAPDAGTRAAAINGSSDGITFPINYVVVFPSAVLSFSKDRTFALINGGVSTSARVRGEALDPDPLSVAIRSLGLLSYSFISDFFDVALFGFNLTTVTNTGNPSYRRLWVVGGSTTFHFGRFTLSPEYGRVVDGELGRLGVQQADVVLQVSF
jgi:hypothetical protein